jgi:predicted ArsR family transcriptional regulator
VTTQALLEPEWVTSRLQARALGDPTRHRVYRAIEAASEPVTVAELTAQFGLNHNAIRQHLALLCQAGLIIEDLAPPTGPGRRRLRYRLDPTAAAAWGGENPYERLSVLLVEAMRSGRRPYDVGVDAGRRLATGGRHRRANSEPLDVFVDMVARQGFEPTVAGGADHSTLVLGHCPFAAAAAADPAVVCELHRGLAEGMADALGGLAVADLAVRDPRRDGCRLRVVTTQGGADDV